MELTSEEQREMFEKVISMYSKIDDLERKGCKWGEKRTDGLYTYIDGKIKTIVGFWFAVTGGLFTIVGGYLLTKLKW